MKILITGVAGYVGSMLARILLSGGHRVVGLDRLMYGDSAVRGLYGEQGFKLIVGDIRSSRDVIDAAEGMDAVVHMAAIVGEPACNVIADDAYETNIGGSAVVASAAAELGIERLILASTCSVYGEADPLLDETSSPKGTGKYAKSKIAAEEIFMTTEGVRPTVLRFGTAYGFGYRPRFDLVANLMAAQAMFDAHVIVINGGAWRPFVHVKDIAVAIASVLKAPPVMVGQRIFNVVSQNLQISDVGFAACAGVQTKLSFHFDKNAPATGYKVRGDYITAITGFTPSWDLSAGMDEVKWSIRAGKVKDYRLPEYSNIGSLKLAGMVTT